MDTSKIEKLLQRCELDELRSVEKVVNNLISKLEGTIKLTDDEEGRKRRKEERFSTHLLGTLTRITDVKPGEKKEYSVTVSDISRNGMCLHVDMNFTPSKVVEITFAGPGGKIKRCSMEIVRMRKMASQDGDWLEVGCKSISNDEIRRIKLQEEQVAKTRSMMHKRHNIIILVVGTNAEITEKNMINRLKTQQYNVRCIDSYRRAFQSAERVQAQLAIFCNGTELAKDREFLKEFNSKPEELATLAIVKSDIDRATLMKNGVDECLSRNNYEEFLSHAIERAMIGHSARYSKSKKQLTGRALICTIDSSRINLISYQLEENGYSYRLASTLDEVKNHSNDPYDLIFSDYDPDAPDEFIAIKEIFDGLPVIALCDDIADGQNAIVDGASNYLCMPPSREDIRMILEMTKSKIQGAS